MLDKMLLERWPPVGLVVVVVVGFQEEGACLDLHYATGTTSEK